MVEIRRIDDEYSVAGQITVDDLDEIKALGFRSIVCNRPDGEEAGQPEFAQIAARAGELGLEIRHVPVGGHGVAADDVTAMVDVLDEFPRPILGFCRSGNRSTVIYDKTRHIRS